MEHILDIEKQSDALHTIFKKIKESNTILFLGAGASVGEKVYLSKQLIEYYEATIHKSINEQDITKFIDILSANESFNRNHFDKFVVDVLRKLPLTEAHKVLATIPWREIITTNYDLLVEQAYDEIGKTSQKLYELKVIRNLKQSNYKESNSEVKYIKLNGCMSDYGQYPLAFSTDDFNKQKSFYKNVLQELKNLSDDISFLSIGYSFSDEFGKQLLDKFDSFNYREKKWMINVDPFPNEHALDYYKKNRMCIIKCSFQDFFLKFKDWETKHADELVRKKGISITNSKNQYITVPAHLQLNLDGIVKQLNTTYSKGRFVKESEFYKGEEPNFNLITRNADVVKATYLDKFKNEIINSLKANGSTFIPIYFINGDFGIGKSTFTLRLIYELEKVEELDLVAFEILDFNRLKKEFLIDLVLFTKSKHVVFFCDEVEIESYFKSLLDIQRDLSIEQFQDCNVFFIVPIRENILEKYKLSTSIPHSHSLKIDGMFEKPEIEELLEKLKTAGLVEFRDAGQKRQIVERIQRDYDSDSFILLMSIITNGKHESDLISAYHELSPDAQKAFLFTALLHKHKLLMPASWLKQNISLSWEEFTSKVVKAEGKGILIQEVVSSHGTQPDLYFRTKHPLIAEKLIEKFLPHKDKQFAFYEKMLKTIDVGQTNSYLANNLLKAFVKSEEFNSFQLNKLFDAAFTKLSDDPYFLLNYAINLQSRRIKSDLKKAIDLLVYAEGLLDYRNHRFIHRRGVLNFELAKLYFDEEKQLSNTIYHLQEAKDLFITKQLYDPFSAYSYFDYIRLLLWELNNIVHDEESEMQKQILIEELFDVANRTVSIDLERVNQLQGNYASYIKKISNNKDYKMYLDELHSNVKKRPYACILLYNYYESKEDYAKCDDTVEEMELYQENFEIVKFLFKYYGRNLYDHNIRIKFLRVSRENPDLEKDNALRFNYFNFIAESYNGLFFDGKKYLANIQTKFHNINPEFHYVWKDSDGNEMLFDGIVLKNSGERFKAIKIPSLQQTFRLKKGNYEKYVAGKEVKVKLHFYLYGIMGEILGSITSEEVEEDI